MTLYDAPLPGTSPYIYTHTELGSNSTYPESTVCTLSVTSDGSGYEQHDPEGDGQQQSGDCGDNSEPRSMAGAPVSTNGI